MSSKTTELCLLLVEETYGELAARIFKVLMVYGRQQLLEIVRRTGLGPSQIRHGLAVLIQQNIVVWSADKTTLYEADWLAAYSLVRSGKFVIAAKQRTSPQVGAILSHCLRAGNVKASELENAESNNNSDQGNVGGVNGSLSKFADAQKECYTAIYDLLESSMVVVTNASHFRGPEDNRERAEKHVRAVNPHWKEKVKNVDKPSFNQAIIDTLDTWTYGSKQLQTSIKKRRLLQLDGASVRQLTTTEEAEDDQQISDEAGKVSKLPPLNGTLQNSFDDRIMLRANQSKYHVLARSQKLVKLAADKIGAPTSQVYATVLQLYDKGITHCKEFQRDPETPMYEDENKKSILTTREILQHTGDMRNLKEAVGQPHKADSVTRSSESKYKDLHRTKRQRLEIDEDDQPDQANVTENGWSSNTDSDIDWDSVEAARSKPNGKPRSRDTGKTKPNGKHKEKEKVQIAYEHDTDMSSESEDDDSSSAVRHITLGIHLKILAEHHLLRYHPPGTYDLRTEGWSVPFVELSHQLRIAEMNATICAHLNTVAGTEASVDALRIVQVLQKQGKLDEKSLTALTLMDNKSIRSRLAVLHSKGYVELQELPRDNNRAPSKTAYLWFFDEDRCARQMQQDYYQAMSRCLQRLRMERERAGDVLAKSQRSDVQGREEQFLTIDEMNRLQKWQKVEEQLMGMISRLDDGVLLLRDL